MRRIICILIAVIFFCGITATASAVDIPDGAYGVISVPCLDIELPVYTAEINDLAHRQAIVDAEESALIGNWGAGRYILDHVFSEDAEGDVWIIQKVFAGAYAYFYTIEGNYFYECYLTALTEYSMQYATESINGRMITPFSSHDILLSCCAGDVHHHYVALFRRIKEF